MKTRLSFFIAAVMVMALCATFAVTFAVTFAATVPSDKTEKQPQTYEALWAEIEKAVERDLPKTVISLCNKLLRKAEADGNTGQKLKALAYKTGYEPEYTYIRELETMVGKCTGEVEKMAIHSLLAAAYATSASDGISVFRERTDVSAENRPEDISEWDASMFCSKIMEEISASLSDMDTLMKTGSGMLAPMTTEGWAGEYYNNDMLHVIAYNNLRALNLIRTTLERTTPDRSDVLAFEKSMYDAVLHRYKASGNENAVLLWSMNLLSFVYSTDNDAVSFGKKLDTLISSYGDKDLVCEPLYKKALLLEKQGNLTGALSICNDAIGRFPKYKRIGQIEEIKERLTRASLYVNIPETAYPGDILKLKVTYCNTDGFDLVTYMASEELARKNGPVEKKDLAKCRKLETVHFTLKPTTDLKTRESEVEFTVPDLGCYVISLKANGETDSYSLLRVSRLAILTMDIGDGLDAIVVDRKSGNPVPDAAVTLYDYHDDRRENVDSGTTSPEGRKSFSVKNIKHPHSIRIGASLGKDTHLADRYVGLYGNSRSYTPDNESRNLLALYTDRAVYRPGQTVHVSGIAYSQTGDMTEISADKTISIKLTDVNQQAVETKNCRTNDMGSFSTSFVIPESGLNGMYTLSASGHGNRYKVHFRVEEYKRPTFEVKVESPEGSFRLGDTVIIRGNAKTFSGAPLAGANGKYTVDVSEWRWWRFSNRRTLQSGEIKADAEGNFEISLFLDGNAFKQGVSATYGYAPRKIAMAGDTDEGDDYRMLLKHYDFTVNVDITDAAGETASGTAVVAAGDKPLVLEYSGGTLLDKNKLPEVRISAVNLLRKPVDCKVMYTLRAISNDKRAGIAEKGSVRSGKSLDTKNWSTLESGLYELEYYTVCADGLRCEGVQRITLFSTSDARPATGTPLWVYNDNGKVYYGTSATDATIFMDKFVSGKRTASLNIPVSDSIASLDFSYKEEYGDGATLCFFIVRDGSIYRKSVSVEKPKPEKRLRLKWSVFRDKVQPGDKETWRLRITDMNNRPADAEMLAYMYDASLDKITGSPHPFSFGLSFRRNNPHEVWDYRGSQYEILSWSSHVKYSDYVFLTPDRFAEFSRPRFREGREMPQRADRIFMAKSSAAYGRAETTALYDLAESAPSGAEEETEAEANGGESVPVFVPRSNFSETAFFYPQLRTDGNGEVSIVFTLPESLTKWKVRSLAHTKDLHFGLLEEVVVAQKDLMLQPNLPRFLRTGDMTNFAAKLSNLSDRETDATVTLELFDPATEDVFERQCKNVSVKAKDNAPVSFDYKVTGKYEVLGIRMVAQGGNFSDGEQHLLAVLSDKVSLVESVALAIGGNGKKDFSLASLFNGHSATATGKRLTVEFAANPAWFAVQALPNLAQPETDCVTDWAEALYANSLAKHIATSSPAIRNVFGSWKKSEGGKELLTGSLQRNTELRNILLNETPWVLEAKDEASRIAEISDLFDKSKIGSREKTALEKLSQLQNEDGGWSWFKGMKSNPWMTDYVLTLNTRLALLTGERFTDEIGNMHERGTMFMHKSALEHYKWITGPGKRYYKDKGLDYFTLRYLYLVSMDAMRRGIAGKSNCVPAEYRRMYGYFLDKVAEKPASKSIQEKAMAAVILHNAGKEKLAAEYIRSISEHLTETEECGMFFEFNENPWSFGQMNLNAHVSAMEALDIVAKDTATVEKMKLWLLKQKQTRMWKTGVMTADAVYAILRRGGDWLAHNGEVRMNIGDETLSTTGNGSVTGLGYIKKEFTDSKTVDSRTISVDNNSGGAAWGAVYARFSEEIRDVASNGGKEMSIGKELYIKRLKSDGSMTYELVPIGKNAKVEVGDVVTARIVVRLDRDMDFVMIKEQRAACMEPLDKISGYRFDGNTYFYEEIKDASTNLFFDSMKKGKYVFEINYRVSRTGRYEAGLATLLCAYAPEFAAHSSSASIVVR